MALAGLARIGEFPLVVATGGIARLIGMPNPARRNIVDELLPIGALFGIDFARETCSHLSAVGAVINIFAIGRQHE